MVFLSSSVHGCKTSSAGKEEGVEDRSSAQGLGECRVISSTSSAGLRCLYKYRVQCHKQLGLLKGCIAPVRSNGEMLQKSAVPLTLSSVVLPCDLPKVTGSRCPFPAFPPPIALYPIITRPEKILFHLANLMEKSRGAGGGEASFLLNQPTHFAARDCYS